MDIDVILEFLFCSDDANGNDVSSEGVMMRKERTHSLCVHKGGWNRALEKMRDIPDSIKKENDSAKTQIPQLEEYLSELLRLMGSII